jgi:hypothetical protein
MKHYSKYTSYYQNLELQKVKEMRGKNTKNEPIMLVDTMDKQLDSFRYLSSIIPGK